MITHNVCYDHIQHTHGQTDSARCSKFEEVKFYVAGRACEGALTRDRCALEKTEEFNFDSETWGVSPQMKWQGKWAKDGEAEEEKKKEKEKKAEEERKEKEAAEKTKKKEKKREEDALKEKKSATTTRKAQTVAVKLRFRVRKDEDIKKMLNLKKDEGREKIRVLKLRKIEGREKGLKKDEGRQKKLKKDGKGGAKARDAKEFDAIADQIMRGMADLAMDSDAKKGDATTHDEVMGGTADLADETKA